MALGLTSFPHKQGDFESQNPGVILEGYPTYTVVTRVTPVTKENSYISLFFFDSTMPVCCKVKTVNTLCETYFRPDHSTQTEDTVEHVRTFDRTAYLGDSSPNEENKVPVIIHEASYLYEKAIEERGDVHAMYNLAILLQTRRDVVAEDVRRAKELYERAIEKGNHAGAMFNLAILLQNGGDGTVPDVKRVKELYERAIEEGEHVNAMFNLAILLEDGGDGVDADVKGAKELYERAVEGKGHVGAMVNLAILLKNGGDGVDADVKRAKELYERAIEEGHDVDAMVNLAILLKNGGDGVDADVKQAKELYEKAIGVGGDVHAMVNLANLLKDGGGGVDVDVKRAKELYERAIEEGEYGAIFNLANLLRNGGDGVDVDVKRAKELHETAIENGGHIKSLYARSEILCFGAKNVRRSIRQAIRQLRPRAEKGGLPPSALTRLSRWLRSDEAGDLREPRYAIELLERAIKVIPYAPAIHDLAVLYSRGDVGVKRNFEKSQRLFQLAQRNGVYADELVVTVGSRAATVIKAGEDVWNVVEESLRDAVVQPRECFLMVFGGAGRGKTSVVRSLRGMEFVSEHFATELACVDRVCVLPDGEHVSEEEVEEVRFNSESLVATMSRASLGHGAVCDEKHVLEEKDKGGPCNSSNNTGSDGSGGGDMGDGNFCNDGGKLLDINNRGIVTLRKGNESIVEVSEGRNAFGPCGGFVKDEVEDDGTVGLKENEERSSTIVPIGEKNENIMCAEEEEKHDDVLEKVRIALTSGLSFPDWIDGALVLCWDLAGQSEYEMAHCLFVGPPGVKLFVIDLEKFCKEESREDEVRELCQWMQLAYCSSDDIDVERPIIVGTRKKNARDDWRVVWADMIKLLRKMLGAGPYNAWVQEKEDGEGGFRRRLQFVAIENSISREDKDGSGLKRLEEVVKKGADEIVESREGVPARWVAFIEKLEKRDRIYMTKEEVDKFIEKFPGFSRKREEREKDALEALRFYRGVGRLVLFEMKEGEYYVFMDPEKILEFVRAVTGPRDLMENRLGQQEALKVEEGILTEGGLEILWSQYSREKRRIMLNLLCKFDFVMRLKGNKNAGREDEMIIGIPGLVKREWDGVVRKKREGQEEIVLASDFEDGLPRGLVGMFISYLHRTLGEERTDVKFVWSNAVMLNVGPRDRVIVEFLKGRRRVLWKVRGDDAMRILWACVGAIENFLREPLHASQRKMGRTHKIVCNCQKEPTGCGSENSVEFGLHWGSEGMGDVHLEKLEGECVEKKCGEKWELRELMDVKCDSDENGMGKDNFGQDCFVSHIGTERHSVVYPSREESESRGLGVLRYDDDLRICF